MAERAYAVLREAIVTGALAPGQVVSEAVLAARAEIGRTPVREAVKRLALEGLVTVLPQRGIVVAPIDLAEQILVLEVLRGLEPILVMRATRRSGAAQKLRLLDLAKDMERAMKAADMATYLRADVEFDELVDRCAQNPFATDAVQQLHVLWRRFWLSEAQSHDVSPALKLNIALVRAIASGNEESAVKAVNTMLDFSDAYVRRLRD